MSFRLFSDKGEIKCLGRGTMHDAPIAAFSMTGNDKPDILLGQMGPALLVTYLCKPAPDMAIDIDGQGIFVLDSTHHSEWPDKVMSGADPAPARATLKRVDIADSDEKKTIGAALAEPSAFDRYAKIALAGGQAHQSPFKKEPEPPRSGMYATACTAPSITGACGQTPLSDILRLQEKSSPGIERPKESSRPRILGAFAMIPDSHPRDPKIIKVGQNLFLASLCGDDSTVPEHMRIPAHMNREDNKTIAEKISAGDPVFLSNLLEAYTGWAASDNGAAELIVGLKPVQGAFNFTLRGANNSSALCETLVYASQVPPNDQMLDDYNKGEFSVDSYGAGLISILHHKENSRSFLSVELSPEYSALVLVGAGGSEKPTGAVVARWLGYSSNEEPVWKIYKHGELGDLTVLGPIGAFRKDSVHKLLHATKVHGDNCQTSAAPTAQSRPTGGLAGGPQ